MNWNSTSVALVTEDRLFADILIFYLATQSPPASLEISSDPDAIPQITAADSWVVLFDADLPCENVFNAIDRIRRRSRSARVALLAARHVDLIIEQALRHRVDGYLSKAKSRSAFVNAIRTIANGNSYFSETIKSRLRFDPTDGAFHLETGSLLSALTGRQLEVVRHVASGLTTNEIAARLYISPKSVESHKYRIMSKLNLHDRVELARLAIREGFISP